MRRSSRCRAALGVFEPGLGVVDGAGADHDEQAVVVAVHDGAHLVAGAGDEQGALAADGQLIRDLVGRRERDAARDVHVCRGIEGFHRDPVLLRERTRAEPAETAKARANALACRL
jgi:hypothetical protein